MQFDLKPNSRMRVVLLVLTLSACGNPNESIEQPTGWTSENGCGLHKDVFFVKLFQSKLEERMSTVREFHSVKSPEYLEELAIEQRRIIEVSKNAFELKEEREPRFKRAFELLHSPYSSEEYTYVKLRISDALGL